MIVQSVINYLYEVDIISSNLHPFSLMWTFQKKKKNDVAFKLLLDQKLRINFKFNGNFKCYIIFEWIKD
jgi:hypothetical protein